jgi:hypothetical protein
MAKIEAVKRAEMMREEWWKSKSTESTINDLIGLGVLHNRELARWRPAGSNSYPNPQPGEIVVFEDFFMRGFGVPIHLFLQGLYLEIQGHPQDGRQHVYICRERGDHYVYHEEIAIDEETAKVEREARRLIREVQVGGLLDHYRRPALVCGHA